ncbi:hypothetical protein [Chitinophaga arvensicola]|uniref:Uncharacterized protein n=1 Tax=Chitinophaga arvensicola TaxID=29529 RepID=A0A1I0S4X8_9BACT|nr:hypothetical protein [Chitinophaga arvensicola]SEW49842.1 hypothetical protein SAMN04488122_3605 [Chitinophaga arvensicola]
MTWNRAYYYYLLFGDITPDYSPWETTVWTNNIYPVLDKLLSLSGHYKQTGISSLQYVPKPGTPYFQPFKPGRLSWNAAAQDKWTLDAHEVNRRFHHLDIWTPSRSVCAKLNSAPDIFFSLFNERNTFPVADPTFETFTVVAVAQALNADPLPGILALSAALKAKKTVFRMRGWEEKQQDENWELTNSIQDTMSANIYQKTTGALNKAVFADIPFEPFWKVVYER